MILNKPSIILLLFVFTIVACNKSESTFEYSNSFENYTDWGFNHPTLKSGNAHSGTWYCELDSLNQFSIGFIKKIKDLKVKSPKKITLSGWIYLPNFDSKANFVVTVGESGKEPVIWNGLNTEDLLDKEKEWLNLTGEFNLPPQLNPEHTLMIYFWNHGKYPVWCDDLSFNIE